MNRKLLLLVLFGAVWVLVIVSVGIFLIVSDDDDEYDIIDLTANVKNYLMIATGQVTLYDNDGAVMEKAETTNSLYGQDATYLKGATMEYHINGDGTVTDMNNGLMWQKSPSDQDFTFDDAAKHCENLELGDYTDWRAPSLKELFSISDFSVGWPYLNRDYFDLVDENIDKSEQYWSSNHYAGWTVEGQYNAAFGVNHVTGHIKAYKADAGGPVGGKYVRCVRGDEYGINDFTDNGDDTVTDASSNLMWTKNDNAEGINWEAALEYAKNSVIGGYSDWRLPNVKELQGIADYNYSPSAQDTDKQGPALNPIFNATPIKNENGDDDYPYYWTGTSAPFRSNDPYYYAWYYSAGRAVNNEGLDFHGAGAVRFDKKYGTVSTGSSSTSSSSTASSGSGSAPTDPPPSGSSGSGSAPTDPPPSGSSGSGSAPTGPPPTGSGSGSAPAGSGSASGSGSVAAVTSGDPERVTNYVFLVRNVSTNLRRV